MTNGSRRSLLWSQPVPLRRCLPPRTRSRTTLDVKHEIRAHLTHDMLFRWKCIKKTNRTEGSGSLRRRPIFFHQLKSAIPPNKILILYGQVVRLHIRIQSQLSSLLETSSLGSLSVTVLFISSFPCLRTLFRGFVRSIIER
jgi:hypothetical protein